MIEKLALGNFCNFTQFSLPFGPKQILIGANGTGKSNLLDALAVACNGRSFRRWELDECIQHQQKYWKLGIRSTKGELLLYKQYKQSLQYMSNAGEQRTPLPLVLVASPYAGSVATQEQTIRRQFLHTYFQAFSPAYALALQKYNKLLQECRTLSDHPKELALWLDILHKTALQLEAYGKHPLRLLQRVLGRLQKKLQLPCTQQHFYRGWDEDLPTEWLTNLSSQRSGSVGYHVSRWYFSYNTIEVAKVFSRGQQKVLHLLICGAIAYILHKRQTEVCLCFDDIAAEVDNMHLDKLMFLRDLPVQLIFTATPDEYTRIPTWLKDLPKISL